VDQGIDEHGTGRQRRLGCHVATQAEANCGSAQSEHTDCGRPEVRAPDSAAERRAGIVHVRCYPSVQAGCREIDARRATALEVLSNLTGRTMGEGTVFALPDLEAAVDGVAAAGGAVGLRERPEFVRLARTRERLALESAAVAARARPQLRAFGQAGLGRPGPYRIFDDEVHEFWAVGVRLQWEPWRWGTDARDRELLRVQEQVILTEETALAARLAREVESELQAIGRLERALETDERIIALREQVERQTRRQFEERALTASQYLTVRTELFEARVAWQRHRVELERARARYLTTLGITPDAAT
jgi:outer membrane protein TolC